MNLTFDLMTSPTLQIEVQYSMQETTPDQLWWSMTMLSVSKWRPAADMHTGEINPHLFLLNLSIKKMWDWLNHKGLISKS